MDKVHYYSGNSGFCACGAHVTEDNYSRDIDNVNCEDCKKNTVEMPKTCRQCGNDFMGKVTQFICPHCVSLNKATYVKPNYRRPKTARKALNEEIREINRRKGGLIP